MLYNVFSDDKEKKFSKLNPIANTTVPLFDINFNGIDMDIMIAPIARYEVSDTWNFNLNNNENLINKNSELIDKLINEMLIDGNKLFTKSVVMLSGSYRAAFRQMFVLLDKFKREIFKNLLKAIKHWAKRMDWPKPLLLEPLTTKEDLERLGRKAMEIWSKIEEFEVHLEHKVLRTNLKENLLEYRILSGYEEKGRCRIDGKAKGLEIPANYKAKNGFLELPLLVIIPYLIVDTEFVTGLASNFQINPD
uniref:Uncharacterized protein n=1 Tax=Meloidogyne javanica TaxID=6303 RepID=A0A915LGU8_MELJA